MMTVNEVSKLTGVSIRTLQYYDTIGLLPPTEYTEAGYRLYDDTAMERLQQILLFKELEFPLKEIKKIIDAPNFDRSKALEQQIELLTMKKEHLEVLISFARKIKTTGVNKMDFKVFEAKKDNFGNYISGGYSLPKGFVFPKWEGREKLTFPEIEFWQEP